MITIPTFTELYNDVVSDIETKFGDSLPAFGKVFLRVMAAVQAGKLKIYYLVIANLQKNIFIDTAEPEANGGTLERFGRVKLGRNPFAATAGQYEIQVTGDVGAIIPAGTQFKSNEDATNPDKLFIVDTPFELLTTPDTLVVRALEAGLDSQMEVGEEMTATVPLAGVDRVAEVISEEVTPLAAEDLEAYRQKAINAFRTEPNGGAASDYRLWAQDAQGVAQVYPFAKSGATGEINLYIEATTVDSTDGKGTPSAAIIEAVEEVIEFDPDTTKPLEERGRRPLGVFQINYLPVSPKDIVISIDGYVNLTSEIQTLIEAGLEELVSDIRPFVAGADILAEKNSILNTNMIAAAIIAAKPGSVFGTVTMTVAGVPYTSFEFLNGDIPYFSSVGYT